MVSSDGRNTSEICEVVLSSSRRVKKGPGRRPQSAKRQRFMELARAGVEHPGAAREVGVSRTPGNNWARGYKVYRRGQAGRVRASPGSARGASDQRRFLSQDERIEIADLRHAGLSIRQIARRLGRAPSTISRELRRNATTAGAIARSRRTAARPRDGPAVTGDGSTPTQSSRLWSPSCWSQRWSPQQISRHLRRQLPRAAGMWLCHESIYQAVYQPGSALMRPSPLAPQRRSPLRTGRDHRRAQQRTDAAGPGSSSRCSRSTSARSRRGPLRGRALGGRPDRRQGPALRDRHARRAQTRLVRLLHLPSRDGDTLHDALKARMGDLPPALLRSITWDQGTEMARHLTITKSLGAPVYFCDSHSPWQRGSNENTNGLLRDYFPKGTDLRTYTAQTTCSPSRTSSTTAPDASSNDRSPAELFTALLASANQSMLRR